MLKPLGQGQGYLKAGFLGFAGSGKTFTATLLALELHKMLKSKLPVAFFDTEAGAEHVNGMIKKATGMDGVAVKSRALSDLLSTANECTGGASDILIVDSITHVWREVCEAYLKELNEERAKINRRPRQRLEFQDWQHIKRKWNEWADLFLNSKLNIIICGRAGFEWEFEESENSRGQIEKNLVKVGVKMKVENEFGFEPSLLVEMERLQIENRETGKFHIVHQATVLKDRFDVMQGQSIEEPPGAWFRPHLAKLVIGASNVVETEPKTPMGLDESGDAEWDRERKAREIALEEIEGEFRSNIPGQSAEDKKNKVDLLADVFGTRSWTAISQLPSHILQEGLKRLHGYFIIGEQKPAEPEQEAPKMPEGGQSSQKGRKGRAKKDTTSPSVQTSDPPANTPKKEPSSDDVRLADEIFAVLSDNYEKLHCSGTADLLKELGFEPIEKIAVYPTDKKKETLANIKKEIHEALERDKTL